jgi:ABC-2 type transport system permease protein
MPVMMIVAFAFIFSGEPKDLFKVGVLGAPNKRSRADPTVLLATPHIDFVPMDERAAAAVDQGRSAISSTCCSTCAPTAASPATGSTPSPPNGAMVERLLLGAHASRIKPGNRSPPSAAAAGEASAMPTGSCPACWP